MKAVVSKGHTVIHEVELPFNKDMVELSELSYTIGRSEDCHLVLTSYDVSRNHACIIYENSHWYIKKLGTSGPVYLNGESIDKASIKSGDIVQISSFKISFDFEESESFSETLDVSEPPQTQLLDSGLHTEELAPESSEEVGHEQVNIEEPELETVEEAHVEIDDEFQEENFEEPSFENDNFEEESFEDNPNDLIDSDLDDEKTQFARSFVEFSLDISGEYTNFEKYYINTNEVFIGRDPAQCQIVVDDPEASQVHAVLKKQGTSCILTDLKSSNGTMLNGKRINEAILQSGDEFLVGSTSFTLKVKSDLISSQKSSLMPVDSTEEIEVEEILEEEVDFLDEEETPLIEGGEPVIKSQALFSKDALKDPEKRKKILYIVVGLLVLWILLDEEKPAQTQVAQDKEPQKKSRDLFENNQQPSTAGNKLRTIDQLPEELQEVVAQNFELARAEVLNGKFDEGLRLLDKVFEHVDNYKTARDLEIFAKDELAKIEKREQERIADLEKIERQKKVETFLAKANEAFDEKKMDLVKSLLNKVLELDPESLEVSQLKLQVENYEKEQERIALEEAQKKSRRDYLLKKLTPGKTLFLRDRWYQSSLELEKVVALEDNDEDLIKEATQMLKDSQSNLKELVGPLKGKARSLKEGQDLKAAYETYREIVKIDPSEEEAINELASIKQSLDKSARQVYRDALIDESLSLLKSAKEKFQEVQQIAPSDSQYHKKASAKLKNYVN